MWFAALSDEARKVYNGFVDQKVKPKVDEAIVSHDGQDVSLDPKLVPTDGSHGEIWDSQLNCHSFAKMLIQHFGLQWPDDIVLLSERVPLLVDLSFWTQSHLRGMTDKYASLDRS
eukprot:TRINITY_DN2069_c1_g3_i2.p1 TRINITY_DN2069_c1_g3~~TRINITY_DN2069_c1_g3_i2.p1  ORF type:complete len:115 (-),score=17.97 TRINITY_DN2069_c1_g3_i2:24-368(-)